MNLARVTARSGGVPAPPTRQCAAWREGSPISLETATYIDALVVSNPDGADARSTADDHLRLIKASLKRTFPQIGGAVSASAVALSYTNDLSASAQAQLNALRDGSATAKAALVATTATTAANASALGGVAAAGYAALATANDFTANQRIIKSVPVLRLNDSSQAADRKSWRMGVTGLTMFLGAETDEGTAGYNFLVVTRSATYAQTIAFAGGAMTFNGVAVDNPIQLNGVASSAYARLDQAQTFNGGQGSTPVNATYGTTITLNMANGNYHRVALTGNATLAAPSAGRPGQVMVVRFVQSTAGGWSVTWNTVFRFTGHVVPTLTNSLSAVDIFCFIYDDVDGYWQQAGLDVGR